MAGRGKGTGNFGYSLPRMAYLVHQVAIESVRPLRLPRRLPPRQRSLYVRVWRVRVRWPIAPVVQGTASQRTLLLKGREAGGSRALGRKVPDLAPPLSAWLALLGPGRLPPALSKAALQEERARLYIVRPNVAARRLCSSSASSLLAWRRTLSCRSKKPLQACEGSAVFGWGRVKDRRCPGHRQQPGDYGSVQGSQRLRAYAWTQG